MLNEIIHELTDYITAYDKYRESLVNNRIINKLAKVHNELLDIAEKNADSYENFCKECLKRNIDKRFYQAVKTCRKEFEKQL